MSNWHRIFYYLQFSVLAVFIAVLFIQKIQGNLLMASLMFLVYFTEIGILENQRKMNKNLIFYRKSGFFALLDLISVTAFLVYSFIFAVDYFFLDNIHYLFTPFVTLIIYTLLRKIYIYKHYSYEK